MTDPLVGMLEIAELLNVPVNTVKTWRSRNQLPAPCAIVGRTPVWTQREILDWANEGGMPRHRAPRAPLLA